MTQPMPPAPPNPPPFAQAVDAADLVAKASAPAVLNTLAGVASALQARGAWFDQNHPYGGLPHNPLPCTGPEMAEYLAYSAIVHCFDGWNYLSQAFRCLISGDRRTAVHLGYYAELRAGMALLATQGLGVFATTNIAIDSSYVVWSKGRAKTHSFVWEALGIWATNHTPALSFMGEIKVERESLRFWLDNAGATAAIQSRVAADWLRAWSVDLQVFHADHTIRDNASYRPNALRLPAEPLLRPEADILLPLLLSWSALEPTPSGAAHVLDSHLLRQAMEFAYPIYRPGGTPGSAAYNTEMNGWPVPMSSELIRFMRRNTDADRHYLLAQAQQPATTHQPQPILARALLLLRVATAECVALLKGASVSMPELSYWWQAELLNHGILNPPTVTRWAELWDDVGAAKSLIEDWLAAGPDPSQFDSLRFVSEHVAVSQFQRCALWLMAS